jgi:hypothetical protein
LYFHKDVDIRHFVIEPLFVKGGKFAFQQDDALTKQNYCTFTLNNDQGFGGSFGNFSAIDRQTILNDDDGSLTGLKGTISVNEDSFFNAPTETIECESEGTAKTSPYDYITTVVYPGCAVTGNCSDWDSDCGSSFCYGVPLYRQLLTKGEAADTKGQEIRMMGMNFFQRSNLTANHGVYYIDTTVSKKNQLDGIQQTGQAPSVNVFKGGQKYYVLLLFAKADTKQTYLIYVGEGFNPETDVERVNSSLKVNRPIPFTTGAWPAGWTRKWYKDDPSTGILEVTVDFSGFSADFDSAKKDRCKPESFCEWKTDSGKCGCKSGAFGCDTKLGENNNTICDWAVRAVDCPTGGCYGFSFTLPHDFPPENPVPPPAPCCFPDNPDWNVKFERAPNGAPPKNIAGSCSDTPAPDPEFCTMPACPMGL